MTAVPEPDGHDLDRMRRDQLAELDNPASAVATVLDDWLYRAHDVTSSHHNVGLFLGLLAAQGWRVTRIPESGPIPPLDPA